MLPCLYDTIVLHFLNMKSRRTEGFWFMVCVENDTNHV